MCSPPALRSRKPAAAQACGYEDWWWKARLGKAYYQLGLLRDAEQQLASSLRNQVRCHWRLISRALELQDGSTTRCSAGRALPTMLVEHHTAALPLWPFRRW